MKILRSHRELIVYQLAYNAALEIYNLSKSFPKEELYALTVQIRKSSRSVPANISEAFRKRRYEKAFVAKITDAEGEAAETQNWLDFSRDHGYITKQKHNELDLKYDQILGKLVNMANNPDKWSF
ncbi:MAG: four helix bundle protein [Marinilabiliaceae bacterium]|jgi:four helix bundle protein|nr:four helix bundle protein [Marinilabiliaceae bacterium]